MDFIRQHTTAVLGGVIVLFAIVGYVLFFSGGSSTSTSALSVTKPGASQGVSQELLATLLQLHSITLDETIWQDQSFRSLRDFGIELAPAPIGRDNPFAPLGNSTLPAGKSGSTAPIR